MQDAGTWSGPVCTHRADSAGAIDLLSLALLRERSLPREKWAILRVLAVVLTRA